MMFNDTDAAAPIDERLDEVARKVAALPSVANATAGSDVIEVSYVSGLEGAILYVPEGSTRLGPGFTGLLAAASDTNVADEPLHKMAPAVTATTATMTGTEAMVVVNSKVLVCAPLDDNDDEPRFREIGREIANIFRNAADWMPDFEVTYLPYKKCTVDVLMNMSDYGTIVFYGHGAGGKLMLLATDMDSEKHHSLYQDKSLRIGTFHRYNGHGKVTRTYSAPMITKEFVRKYLDPAGSGKGRVVFTVSCESTKQVRAGDLEDAFSRAGAHIGFDDIVTDRFGEETAEKFFRSLTSGSTVQDAYDSIRQKVERYTRHRARITLHGGGALRYEPTLIGKVMVGTVVQRYTSCTAPAGTVLRLRFLDARTIRGVRDDGSFDQSTAYWDYVRTGERTGTLVAEWKNGSSSRLNLAFTTETTGQAEIWGWNGVSGCDGYRYNSHARIDFIIESPE